MKTARKKAAKKSPARPGVHGRASGRQGSSAALTRTPDGEQAVKATTQNAPGNGATSMRPSQCRTYLRRRLAESFATVTDAFVKQAAKGGVQHVREFLRLSAELNPEKKPKRRGSATELVEALERLDEAERNKAAAESPANDKERGGAAIAGDAAAPDVEPWQA